MGASRSAVSGEDFSRAKSRSGVALVNDIRPQSSTRKGQNPAFSDNLARLSPPRRNDRFLCPVSCRLTAFATTHGKR